MAEKRISKFRLKDLPDELKEKLDTKFWTTPAIERTSRSSFGTSPKSKESVFHDDGYAVVKLSQEWVAVDKYNSNHGRVRVESSLGKLLDTPGAGHYTPKIDMQSKRETIAPPITISEKPADHFFEELEDLKNTRTEILKLTAPLAKERKKRTKIATYKIKRGDLADVNIDDMRKGLLPGPGTYVIDCPLAERFEKPPTPKLKPKKNAAIPRKVILPETLDILDSPSQKQPAVHYDLDNDPRKSRKSFTIGEVLPLPKKDFNTCTGPGYYNIERVMSIGEINVLSSTEGLKKKPVGSFETYKRAMSRSRFAKTKSSFPL